MSTKYWIILVAAIAILGAAYLGSPFWAAREFKQAALSGDRDDLEAIVDFPAVRESLKSQLNVAMMAKFEKDPEMKGNPFSGFAMMMLPSIVEKAVDNFLTPDGLAALIKKGRAEKGAVKAEANPKIEYDYDYRSLDRFVATPHASDVKVSDAPKLIFDRRGMLSWKLVRIELPANFMDK